MVDLIRNILTNPFWAIISIVLLWFTLFQFFSSFAMSDVTWKKLEYIWIFTGLIGLLTIINENDKAFKEYEVNSIRQNIRLDISNLTFYLDEMQACMKYTKTDFSPPDLELRQSDQDKICKWAKAFKINEDSVERIPITLLDTFNLKSIPLKTDFMNSYVSNVNETILRINSDILKFNEYNEIISSKTWENFTKSFGPLLLILAFAIRLAIATRNIKLAKLKK